MQNAMIQNMKIEQEGDIRKLEAKKKCIGKEYLLQHELHNFYPHHWDIYTLARHT